ncbi:MAG: SurA N-terminal domain-containing protein [Alphaproteobacteria bacterium]|nr:SurA N-terminal domain-containing protein [Alphaproteobacteria bacterium]
MLQAIRGRASSWVIKGLFIILALSFVTWGVEGFIGQMGSGNQILKVGGTVYDTQNFDQQIQRQIKTIEKQIGGSLTRVQLRELGVYQQAQQRIVDNALIDAEAKELGIVTGDRTINLILRSTPGMVQADGSLNTARLTEIIRQSGYGSEEAFIKNLRSQIATGSLMRAVASVTAAPNALIDQMNSFRNQRRRADFVTIQDSTVTGISPPTEVEIATYHQSHSADFTAPEYRRLNYAILDPKRIAAEIKPTVEELRKEYGETIDRYTHGEKRTVWQIPFSEEAAAKTAADQLKTLSGAAGTAGFQALARQQKMVASDLSLGSVIAKQLPPELDSIAFSLKLGETSQPVKTDFGWNLLHVSQITPKTVDSFEAIQTQLRTDYIERKSSDLLYDRINRIEAALDGGAEFATIAQQYSLPVKTVGPIDEQARSPDGTKLIPQDVDGVIPSNRFIAEAFHLKLHESSAPIEIKGNGVYFIVNAADIVPPSLRPLDKVRAAVVQKLNQDRRRDAAEESAKALTKRLNDDKTISLKSSGLKVTASRPFTRDGFLAESQSPDPADNSNGSAAKTGKPSELSPQLISLLFKEQRLGRVVMARGRDNQSWVVAQVTDSANGDYALTTAMKREFTQAIQADLIAAYVAHLRTKHKVTLNQKLFDQYY